jgi:hypothetical protein
MADSESFRGVRSPGRVSIEKGELRMARRGMKVQMDDQESEERHGGRCGENGAQWRQRKECFQKGKTDYVFQKLPKLYLKLNWNNKKQLTGRS